MKRPTLIFVALLAACLSCGAATKKSDFPYVKQLAPVEGSARKTASLELDEEVFSRTSDNYANLRVFSATGTEIPFLVRTSKQKKEIVNETAVPMKKIELKELENNEIELIFKRKKDDKKKDEPPVFPEVISFSTSIRNYEKSVTIFGSLDGGVWELLARDKPIFDYSRFIDISNSRVEIKRNRSMYYKIVISNISESQPSPFTRITSDERNNKVFSKVTRNDFRKINFRIDNIIFLAKTSKQVETSRIEKLYPVSDMKIETDPEKQVTLITFSNSRTPLTSLSIITDNANFSRKVSVEGAVSADGGEKWTNLAKANLNRIDIGHVKRDKTKAIFGQSHRFEKYRMTISNLDSPPLDISGIEARGEIHELLFFHKQSETYKAFYGGENNVLPRYDISSVLESTRLPDTDVYHSGAESTNPGYKPSMRAFGSREMLITAILLAAATLIWLISRALKTIDTTTGN